jgi:ubiquitin carboxyl-terminal hydrolase 5/13
MLRGKNSCYMASVIQALFALPAFQQRYQDPREHWITCPEPLPASCLDCQMYKLSDGLLSGRYSHPSATQSAAGMPVFQDGIKPSGFKALVGKGHAEFSTMKQQDSEEFLSYLLISIRRHAKKVSAPSLHTEIFSFGMEQRLQCGECKGVRYRVDPMDVVSVAVPATEEGKDEEGKVKWRKVAIEQCLGGLTGPEALEYNCPACAKNVIAVK